MDVLEKFRDLSHIYLGSLKLKQDATKYNKYKD